MNLDDITNFLVSLFSSNEIRQTEAKVKKDSSADNKQGLESSSFLGFEIFKKDSESTEEKSINTEVHVADSQNNTNNFSQIDADSFFANEQLNFFLENIIAINESNLNIPPVVLETSVTTSDNESNQIESTPEIESEAEASESQAVQSNNEPIVPPYSEPEAPIAASDPIQENLNQAIEHNCDDLELSSAELYEQVIMMHDYLSWGEGYTIPASIDEDYEEVLNNISEYTFYTEDFDGALLEYYDDLCGLYYELEPLAEAEGFFDY